jgi:ankyrin repeat protein/type II secretory pathway predicted ATPase ExeA
MHDPRFGLRRPFGDTADPDVFYPGFPHESACVELLAAVKTLAGLVVLVGEPGTGKTTVLGRVIRDVEGAGGRVLSRSVAAPLDAMVVSLVGQLDAPDSMTPDGRRKALLATLRAHAPPSGATVVAFDEAQYLKRAELEDLRALAEAGKASGLRLSVLLVGQPELDVKLASIGGDRGIRAYVLRLVLARLAASDVGPYVAYRLGQAGARQDVFQPDAIERVAAHAEGIPRVINQLCDAALRTASESGIATVSARIVDAEARQLQLSSAPIADVETPQLPLLSAPIVDVEASQSQLPSADRAAVPGAEYASPGRARPERTRRADSRRTKIRGWSVGFACVTLVVAGAVLFTLQQAAHPPPPHPHAATPPPARAAQRPPSAPGPGALIPGAMPPVAQATPPAPGRTPEEPLRSGRKRADEPSARVATEGRSSPKVAQGPAPSVVRRTDSLAAPALLDNAEAGNLTEVQALLAAGASPDARDATGMTPLMVAVVHDHGAVAELLLTRGADVNAWDDGGVTALMLAANNGLAALLQRLIQRGANVNARTQIGWTALTYAAWSGHPSVARRLLAAGADPALTDRNGWTALQYAARRAADPTRMGAPDAADPSAYTALAQAARLRYTELVNLLSGATRAR